MSNRESHRQPPLRQAENYSPCGWFVRLNAWLLAVTGCLKLYSIVFVSDFRLGSDPILGVSNLWSVGGMALVEVAVGALSLKRTIKPWQPLALFWIASVLLMYRAALVYYDFDGQCSCLGPMLKLLKLSPKHVNWILFSWLIVLEVGTAMILLRQAGGRGSAPSGASLRSVSCKS